MDASVNFLIFAALEWTAIRRARVGMVLASILLIPGLATLWAAWDKFTTPVPSDPLPLSLAGLGALAVNLPCAFMLARFRTASGSLTQAAFLAARNDALANVAIIAPGLVTAFRWRSAWPDLIVGLGIAVLNADATWEAWGQHARKIVRKLRELQPCCIQYGASGPPLAPGQDGSPALLGIEVPRVARRHGVGSPAHSEPARFHSGAKLMQGGK